ncbi:MoaD/ThiS family protein [Desulforamulus aeronauticus]|uniref:ThiS family protein n=1 Tax=Desulforamulus aeronauticus DSM 10349 TaxID=1121421 RepID=A0A1M6NHU5_9FIRM|nr:MoaD/ThiS family protein [Desulforamulus aeronauticus]SHJ95260.1 ThiS family protein [Desulforamulus aeronauticus DSM 10349]
MQITIRVTGLLTEYFPAGKGILPVFLTAPSTVQEILRQIKVNSELVMTVVVNGQRRDLSYTPQDGEEIVLISPLAGG